jgi:hypothetical protein
MLKVQEEVAPLHGPVQYAKVEPGLAAGVRVTEAPVVKMAEQVEPQLMPPELLVTVPVPVPCLEIARTLATTKVAVTALSLSMVTTQVPVPLHEAPLHPVKMYPDAAVAVRVTVVEKLALQVDPQLMPAGELVTVPELAGPDLVTVRVWPDEPD